jgi:transcriptional regulator with XRE-family HTH domain
MIGSKIKTLRKKHNWTQWELAQKIGIDQPHIHRWETGKKSLSLAMLKKISKVFDVSLDALVFEEKDLNAIGIKDKAMISKLKNIAKLNEHDKEMVVNLINSLAEKNAVCA